MCVELLVVDSVPACVWLFWCVSVSCSAVWLRFVWYVFGVLLLCFVVGALCVCVCVCSVCGLLVCGVFGGCLCVCVLRVCCVVCVCCV